MMDGSNVTKGLLQGLKVIGLLLGGIVTFVFGAFIVGIVLGFLFEVAGDLGLDNTTVEFLGNVSSAWYNFAGSLIAGTNLVGNLVQIAIILVVFGGLIGGGYMLYKKSKGNKGSDNSY